MEADPGNPPEGGSDNSVVTADGNFVENWADKYDEADRPTLSRFTKFDDFVTSHMSLRRKFNKDPNSLVEMPNESSSDEVREAFHRARGVPEKPEDYKYERSKNLSEKVEISDEQMTNFAQIGKKWNLTQEQFNGVVNDYLVSVGKDIEKYDIIQKDREQRERQEAFEAGEKVLKKKMGNSYDERVARANLLLIKYAGQEMVAELGLENNPKMTEFLDNIAEDMSEDRIKGLTSISTPTPADVVSKINELKAHPAFTDRNHPQHGQIVEELSELYKKKSA